MGILLDEIFHNESCHLGKSRLTLNQRFNLSVNILKKLDNLHSQGVVLGQISLNDIMVECCEGTDDMRVSIRIPAHANKHPEAKDPIGWTPFNALINEVDIAGGCVDAKSDVCLFGQIFLDLWRVVRVGGGIETLDLLMKGKVTNAFPVNFMKQDALAMIHQLLVEMNSPQRDQRPTVCEAIERFRQIQAVNNCEYQASPQLK